MKNSRASRPEPDFVQSQHEQATVARCESAFVWLGLRSFFTFPCLTAVIGCHHHKMAVHWIAQKDSVRCVPERDGVEKTFRIGVGIEDVPFRAAVFGAVNP